jgi:hypothetical protein
MLILLGVLMTLGCTSLAPRTCAADQKDSVSDLIYFGVDTADGPVDADAWAAFLRDVVTPRFPAGLTTWDAQGQWRSADGSLVRESSHVLNLVHPGDASSENSVRTIIDAYKTRHRQEAVLRVKATACVSF